MCPERRPGLDMAVMSSNSQRKTDVALSVGSEPTRRGLSHLETHGQRWLCSPPVLVGLNC